MTLNITSIFLLAVLPVAASSPEKGVAFYLINSGGGTMATYEGELENLQVDKVPLFDQREIVSYSKSRQSMILTSEALEKLRKVSIGRRFVVCVDMKPIYSGKIWSLLRSASCSDIVLMVPPSNDASVYLLAGYPTHSYFEGNDQRLNESIIDSLGAAGKLKE